MKKEQETLVKEQAVALKTVEAENTKTRELLELAENEIEKLMKQPQQRELQTQMERLVTEQQEQKTQQAETQQHLYKAERELEQQMKQRQTLATENAQL